MTRKKRKAYYFGVIGEYVAIIYLKSKFYKILKRRFKTPHGEIDIIAIKGNVIICIEVKARGAGSQNNIGEIISAKQRNRIRQASNIFIASKPQFNKHLIRFDAIKISPFSIKHFKGMF